MDGTRFHTYTDGRTPTYGWLAPRSLGWESSNRTYAYNSDYYYNSKGRQLTVTVR